MFEHRQWWVFLEPGVTIFGLSLFEAYLLMISIYSLRVYHTAKRLQIQYNFIEHNFYNTFEGSACKINVL